MKASMNDKYCEFIDAINEHLDKKKFLKLMKKHVPGYEDLQIDEDRDYEDVIDTFMIADYLEDECEFNYKKKVDYKKFKELVAEVVPFKDEFLHD